MPIPEELPEELEPKDNVPTPDSGQTGSGAEGGGTGN